MRSFYGGTYIGKERLASSNIYHPVRLEYYKTEETKNFKTAYGIEVIKTEYKDRQNTMILLNCGVFIQYRCVQASYEIIRVNSR